MAADTINYTAGIAAEKPSAGIEATVGRIPVRNIWLLMLYASDLFRETLPRRRAAIEENPDDIPDLVAEILTHSVERRLRRNLSFGFQSRSADLSRVRGRINVLRTESRHLLQRGKIACSFEELTVDTPRNRFVRAALLELVKVVKKPELARRCRAASASLERAGVSDDRLFDRLHGREGMFLGGLGRLDAEDREMLAAAHLAFNLALPTEDPGETHLSSPERDSYWARRLFERAIGGFYNVVLHAEGWKVSRGDHLKWQVVGETSGLSRILPSMQTDIVLESPKRFNTERDRRIVIDTKFTSIIKRGWMRDETLSSGYIYQIYAYLRSQERSDDPLSNHSTGILLHPSVDDADVDEAAVIQGHEIRFTTVNLAAGSREIRERLLQVVNASPFDSNAP